MKFGRSHVYLTTALAAFGMLALIGTVPLPGLAPLQVFAELLIVAQLLALVFRRGASNDSLIFGLALAHFLAATLLGGGLAFLIAFIGLATVLPAALVLSHLRRVMGRGSLAALASLSLPMLGMTAVLFVVLPRLGVRLSLGFAPSNDIGFTDRIDLARGGELHRDPKVALRFWVDAAAAEPPPRMVTRFRGAAMEEFDGKKWLPASSPSSSTSTSTSTTGRAMTIEREPFDPPAVFLPSGTLATHVIDMRDDGPRRYVAYLATDARESVELEVAPSQAERTRDLALPETLPKRIVELAHTWADPEPTPQAKAKAIEQHLRKELAYDLGSPSRGTAQPLDHFLFVSKRGHCELFASSMAVMLRAVGIPSRNASGFLGGEYNRFGGYYVVRQQDAHVWVEAFFDGPEPGWRTFDPTPSGPVVATDTGLIASTRDLGDAVSMRWGSGIVSYDRHAQSALVDALRKPIAIAAALVVAIFIAIGLRRSGLLRPRGSARRSLNGSNSIDGFDEPDANAEAAKKLYVGLEAALVRHGIVRDRAVPPLAHAEDLVKQRHPLAEDVAALTRLYLEVRFGGRPVTREVRGDFERGVGRVLAWGQT